MDMEFLGASRTSYSGGIEFADLESVKNALRAFASGQAPGSNETLSKGFEGKDGGIGLAMKLMVEIGTESRFMQDLLDGVDKVKDDRPFHRSYDYDGIGPFFKCSVEVKAIRINHRKCTYLLDLSAAYVDDKPTGSLATVLGAERALWWDAVVVQVKPFDNGFSFDFDEIMSCVKGIGIEPLAGVGVASAMMRGSDDSNRLDASLVVRNDDLLVRLGIDIFSVGDSLLHGTSEVLWKRSGSVISGPLREDRTPQLTFSVSLPEDPSVRSWDRKPIIDPMLKQQIHDHADAIVAVFQ